MWPRLHSDARRKVGIDVCVVFATRRWVDLKTVNSIAIQQHVDLMGLVQSFYFFIPISRESQFDFVESGLWKVMLNQSSASRAKRQSLHVVLL